MFSNLALGSHTFRVVAVDEFGNIGVTAATWSWQIVAASQPSTIPPPDSACVGTGGGNSAILGGNGGDTLIGTSGNNLMNGQGGTDAMNGCGGNDSVNGNAGNDGITGGIGNDAVS